MEKKATVGRIILLIIVFALIWYLLVVKFNAEMDVMDKIPSSQMEEKSTFEETSSVLVNKAQNLETKKVESSQNQIITQRQTSNLDKEGPLVVKSGGNYYVVQEGSFILDNSKVVEVNQNGKTVQFMNSPRRIISTQ